MSARERSLGAALRGIEAASRDPKLCNALLERLRDILGSRRMRFMEVCGTHTVAIFQSGLRSILPEGITHLSGPGCPVCVTHEAEVALFLSLARLEKVIVATFGDLLRVPGPDGLSLKHAAAAGSRIEVVYSPLDALALARANPERLVVFLAVGFETTAPAVAATVLAARKAAVKNFSILSLHKLVPPALRTLLADGASHIDAFLLPGHVATVTGLKPFAFLPGQFHKPAVVGGFEAADILLALCALAERLDGCGSVGNAYRRAVAESGNPRALELMERVFATSTALWRGLGRIEASGLVLREDYADFDAMKRLDLALPETKPLQGCLCGEVLKGRLQPPQCPLFGGKCAPATPVGPCMVSTEGSCAAHYRYADVCK